MVANRLRDAAAVLEVDSAYRRDAAIMREAADEVERLRHDIARHVAIACELATECERLRAENERLRDALIYIEEYWNRDQNEKAMADACWHAVETARAALAAKGE